MANLDELLSEGTEEPTKRASLDELLDEKPTATMPSAPAKPSEGQAPWWMQAASTGFGDTIHGPAQLMQNLLPDPVMNVARKAGASIAGAMGANELAQDIGRPVSTEQFNRMEREREAGYQAQRKEAGREGMDWWRLGGSLTNPLAWMSPSGEASTLVKAINAGAKAGAFQSLLQPVTSEGNFLWDKGMQAAIGGATGGALSGGLKLLEPALQYGAGVLRRMLGPSASERAIEEAAEQVTKNVTRTAVGDTPVNPDLYSAIRQDVADAMKAGVAPSAEAIARRADAGALPVPIHMTRAQVTRDPMAWAWEHRVSGQQGVGEPLSELLSNQNRALIQNINALGAHGAPTPYAASEQVISKLEQVNEQMRAQVDEAYKAVRNSAGRPAKVSTDGFLQAAKDKFTGTTPGSKFRPEEIENAIAGDEMLSSFGLRMMSPGHKVTPGDILPKSSRWEDGIKTDELLSGTSTIGVKKGGAAKAYERLIRAGYPGDEIALVRGDKAIPGEDAFETVIPNAEVVSLWPGQKNNISGLINLGDYLPEAARKNFNDIVAGKMPLTVDAIQFFDRAWSGMQRGAKDDTERAAIGALRSALHDTPIDDTLGQEAMQAYNQARTLARKRFQLIEENPALKLVDSGKAEPDRFFQKYVQGANVSELRRLRQIVGPEDTATLQRAFTGQLKRAALNKGSDESSKFSQAAYNNIMQDPVQGPRIQELFADNRATLDQLYRLGRVSETLMKPDAAARVNYSNTAVEAANIVRDVARSETGQAISSLLPNWMTGLGRTMGDAGRRVEESRAVHRAVTPGVTDQPLQRPRQAEFGRLSDLLSRGAAATVVSDKKDEKRK